MADQSSYLGVLYVLTVVSHHQQDSM